MNAVKTTYPAIAALLNLVGIVGVDVTSAGALLTKLASLSNVIPDAITLEGLASQLGPEFSAIGALDAADKAAAIEGCVELLVTNFAFSAPAAQKAQAAAFALGEWLVAGVPAIEAIVAVTK